MGPYLDRPANLVHDYLQDHGIRSVVRAAFGLDGDTEMNRVPAEVTVDAD